MNSYFQWLIFMKKLILITTCFFASLAFAENSDISKMEVTDLAICTAAAMKSGNGIATYNDWSELLEKRYKSIYPKMSTQELDQYTAQRIQDKLSYLKQNGILTNFKFKEFYDKNCKIFYPFKVHK